MMKDEGGRMKTEKTENAKLPNALLKHGTDFLIGFFAGSLFFGILIFSFINSREHNFLSTTWALQKTMFMGTAVGIGWMIGKWPLSPVARRRFFMFGLLIAVGFLLFLVVLVVYLKSFRF